MSLTNQPSSNSSRSPHRRLTRALRTLNPRRAAPLPLSLPIKSPAYSRFHCWTPPTPSLTGSTSIAPTLGSFSSPSAAPHFSSVPPPPSIHPVILPQRSNEQVPWIPLVVSPVPPATTREDITTLFAYFIIRRDFVLPGVKGFLYPFRVVVWIGGGEQEATRALSLLGGREVKGVRISVEMLEDGGEEERGCGEVSEGDEKDGGDGNEDFAGDEKRVGGFEFWE